MTLPDFIPQVGLRFSFKDTNFEVTYVHRTYALTDSKKY